MTSRRRTGPSTRAPGIEFPYVWRVRRWLPWMHGKRCRVVIRGRTMNSALFEFECGYRVVSSRNYIRKAPPLEHP